MQYVHVSGNTRQGQAVAYLVRGRCGATQAVGGGVRNFGRVSGVVRLALPTRPVSRPPHCQSDPFPTAALPTPPVFGVPHIANLTRFRCASHCQPDLFPDLLDCPLEIDYLRNVAFEVENNVRIRSHPASSIGP